MNLLVDQWIRCVHQSDGTISRIAPHEITQVIDSTNPIIDVVADRPDFKGALFQFLIGLLQTLAAPSDEKEWRMLWDNPPKPEELKAKFAPMSHAFHLDGEGPAFMQDFDLGKEKKKPISSLLIDSPGENTKSKNKDHFIKWGSIKKICYSCTAISIFTLQVNAPEGGRGHRAGLRGGGPLTTLLLLDETFDDLNQVPHTLWHKVWLNILPEKILKRDLKGDMYNWDNIGLDSIFPWLGPTRTSEEKTGCDTQSKDVHPYQMYWGMPRRIRIDFTEQINGSCDLCGEAGPLSREIVMKKHGINYTGVWEHPLTPYARKSLQDESWPLHGQKGGITYRNWLGMTLGDNDRNQMPALNVAYFLNDRVRRLKMDRQARLWAFGYDMESMKPRCWYDSQMPLYDIDPSIRDDIKCLVAKVIDAAIEMAGNLRKEIKSARYKRPKDVKGDWSFIDVAFWQATEGSFYRCIQEAIAALGRNEALETIQKNAHRAFKSTAMALFDEHALGGPPNDMGDDLERLVQARRNLSIWLQTGKKVKELLGKG